MNYYKYKNDRRIEKRLLKERLHKLTENQQRNHRVNRIMLKASFFLFVVMFIAMFILSLKVVTSYINNDILIGITMSILVVFSVMLPILFLIPIIHFIEKRYPFYGLSDISRDMRINSNSDLFQYYQINDNYIVTKCYDCSNLDLVNKDLMLYFHDGKLRITNDFTRSSYDFGCFEFEINEIEVSYDRTTELLKTVITTEDMRLVLGRRAKPYLRKKGVQANGKI